MYMWPTMNIEEMLQPKYKKDPCGLKKLRFREHDETLSRMRRLYAAYRCTKCDKFGHNSRKCESNEHDPNALKRKASYHKLTMLLFFINNVLQNDCDL